jgi:G3E family GTPase
VLCIRLTDEIAVNQLLAIAKPHRLLIEPTGLGHPKELIQVLSSEHYRDVIKLNNTLCLIDTRKVSDQKWRDHQIFQDQLEIADVIVATKCDIYGDNDISQLVHYLQNTSAADTPLKSAIRGETDSDILNVIF